MDTRRESLDPNFREFLKSLNSAKAKYLVLGGYAVNYYGRHRATKDLDVWIAVDPENARLVSQVMKSFGGFTDAQVPYGLFLQKGKVFAFGREPIRIDLLTSPSGIDFAASYARRLEVIWDGVRVPLIALDDLRQNKQTSGRPKDLDDVENLPTVWPLPRKLRKKKRRKKKRRR